MSKAQNRLRRRLRLCVLSQSADYLERTVCYEIDYIEASTVRSTALFSSISKLAAAH